MTTTNTITSTKTVVITGGTGGIGFQTALALAAIDDKAHKIVITGRSQGSAEKAVAAIKEQTGNQKIEFALADMSHQSQVKALAKELVERYPKIDELISNAGIFPKGAKPEISAEGVEMNLAVNVVSHLILVRGLVPSLSAAGGKIQLVSGGSPMDTLNVKDLESNKATYSMERYSHSKRIMDTMAIALSKELKAKGITVNIVGGGAFAASSMTGAMSFVDMPLIMKPFYPIFYLMKRDDKGKSAKAAAQPNIWAFQQSAEDLGSGQKNYMSGSKAKALRPEFTNEENQKKVLQFAEGLLL